MPAACLQVAALLAALGAPARGQGILDRLDGETLYEGGWLLTIGAEYDRGDDLRRGARRISDPTASQEDERRTTIALQHGLRHDLQIGAAIPWVEHRRSGAPLAVDSAAIGDLSLLGKWRWYRWDAPGKALNVALLGELSLPTGADDAQALGARLEPELQAGSGGLDPALGIGATYEPGRWRLNAAALHRWRTDTDGDGARPGNELVAELALGNRFWLEPYPGPFLRLDAFSRFWAQRRSELAGARLADSGSERATLGLNLAFRPRPQLDFQLSLEIPVWQSLNGTQLGEDWALDFTVGLRF